MKFELIKYFQLNFMSLWMKLVNQSCFLKIGCHSESTLCGGWGRVESALCRWGQVTVTPVPVSADGRKIA